jgi:hypothetical protein
VCRNLESILISQVRSVDTRTQFIVCRQNELTEDGKLCESRTVSILEAGFPGFIHLSFSGLNRLTLWFSRLSFRYGLCYKSFPVTVEFHQLYRPLGNILDWDH